MNSIRVALISSLGATLTAGCATGAPPANVSSTPPNIGRALQEVDASDFLKHIETLASDDFEGRSVGVRGEAVTVDYLVGEFKRIGLMPGNPDGGYIQRVPLTEHTSAPSAIINPVSRMESRGGVQSPARRDDGEAALSENGGFMADRGPARPSSIRIRRQPLRA